LKIYIYATIDDWNRSETDYVFSGNIMRYDNGVVIIRDEEGNQQYINLNRVFCLVEANE
jgi:hypothetical protein